MAPDDPESEVESGSSEPGDDEIEEVEAELVSESELPPAVLPPRLRARDSKSSVGPLARYDPLEAYMRDVQRYRLLTPDEEREVALKYHDEGDLDAAARLVTANLRLVVKIAYDYRRAHRNLSDLIQEGNVGLMQAVKKYDPYKGVKLSTYAAWWIRAYILRFILNNARLVKLGTTQAQRKLFFNLKKEKAKLAAMGIEPSPEIIAGRLNVPTQEVVHMDRRLAAGDASLDTPIRSAEQGAPPRVELLAGGQQGADELLANQELDMLLHEKLAEFGKTLSGKDARIFHERMLSDEPRTLQELGAEFGVSRERVRQLEKRLQMRLKQYLSDELDAATFE